MSKRNNTQSGFSVVSNEVRVFSGELNQIMERLRVDVAHVMRHAASLQKMQKLHQLMLQASTEMQKRGLTIDQQAVASALDPLDRVLLAVAVDVVVLDQRLQLDLLKEQSECVESLFELSRVKFTVSVGVVPLENDFQVSDASAGLVLDLHFDLQ